MALRILMVLDKDFQFAPPSDVSTESASAKFTYTTLVNTLESAGMTVTKAHRESDESADIQNFRFDGPTNLSEFDELWLIGDAGFNVVPDNSPAIADTELRAIAEFMNGGGGVFATGDHDSIGAKMCGHIPRVRAMRKWFAELDPERPTGWPGNWPPLDAGRADTIRVGWFGDGTIYFESQSDSRPQELTLETTPTHPILRTGDRDIVIYPDHMHEGDAIAGWDGFDWNQDLTLAGLSFREFPPSLVEGAAQERPQVLARGEVLSHPTPGAAGGFSEDTPSAPKTTGILSAYDGFAAGVGRIVTGSTFHHYVDLNLTGDLRVDTAEEIAKVGEDAQDGRGFAWPGAAATFDDIKAVYVNTARWLARPPRTITIILDRSTFGQDEVRSMLLETPPGVFERTVFVMVEGLKPSQFPAGGITTLSPSDTQLRDWAPDFSMPEGTNIDIVPVGVDSSDPDLPDRVQQVTFAYNVRFPDESSFSFAGETRAVEVRAELNVGSLDLSDTATIQLTKAANPFMRDLANGNTTVWLSSDVRVFTLVAGESRFGRTLPADASYDQALTYIRDVITALDNGDFTSISMDPAESALSIFPTTTSGKKVYNFAIARVRLRGDAVSAEDVRLFFRIFQSQTTAALTYNAPSGTPINGYRQTSGPTPIALPGTNGADTEYISFPCFASARTDLPQSQTDSPNVKDIAPVAGDERLTFFGCLLDNNLTRPYLPLSPVSGGARLSLADHLMGAHQCLVAQIAFAGAPIPSGANPATSDKLSQRNVAVSEIANPGDRGSRVATHTFEIEATPHPVTATWPADELMLEWRGRVPSDTRVTIYVPTWSSAAVVRLADEFYPNHQIRIIDDHTIQCTAGGTRYVPIPRNAARQVGLLSMQFPRGVRKGQRFDCVIRQVTNKTRSVQVGRPKVRRLDPQEVAQIEKQLQERPQPDLTLVTEGYAIDAPGAGPLLIATPGAAEAALAAANPWREVTGAFQFTVPVSVKEAMLIPHLRLLSVLYWRADYLRPEHRWYKVFLRYIAEIEDKVRGLGGDPAKVPATPDGLWTGLLPDGPEKPDDSETPDTGEDGEGEPGSDSPFPEYGGFPTDEGDTDGSTSKSRTGKISGLLYDHFGDFEGFVLETFDGRHHRYYSRERTLERRVQEAWLERYVITVFETPGLPGRIRHLVVRGYR